MSNLTTLIPLDTTEFAESSFLLLPMLKTLGFTKARLVSVQDGKQKKRDNGAGDLQKYLERQAARVSELGIEAETEIVQGDAASALLEAAGKPDVDLLLMATHGRTGIARLRLGSVGDKLIKDAPCPRLVVGPNIEIDLEHYALNRILVPLDGGETSELALPIARHLSRLTGASIDLLRAVTANHVMHEPMMASIDLLTPLVDQARLYLSRIESELAGHTVTSTVINRRPDEGILEHLRAHPVDLVIMVSRGRTGLGRMALGSVAERVLHGPDPVLIFEPGEDRSRLFEDARATYQA